MTNHKRGLDSLIDVGICTGRKKEKPPLFPLPMRARVERDWPILREKKSKNRPVCKNAVT